MLKAPILSRTTLFAKNLDGSFRRLPFNLVNTSIGGMVEPVSVSLCDPDVKGGLIDADAIDSSFTDQQFVDESAMYSAVGTWGPTVPINLNDPTP